MVSACLAAGAGAAQLPVVSRLEAAALIWGVIDYATWPGAGPPALVCVTEGGPRAAGLAQVASPTGGPRPPVRSVAPDRPVPGECDVVVFEGWGLAAQQRALRAQAHRPVLSLGFDADFCSDGGMVCLRPTPSGWTFEVNTDAVARAGLRIHPRVLWLARPRGGAG